jgi:hypothetical protein
MNCKSVHVKQVGLVLIGLLVLHASVVSAVDTKTSLENLISDPGFEMPVRESPWSIRNWWKRQVTDDQGKLAFETNACEYVQDPDNPHTGKYSQKIALKKFLGGDLQFHYPLNTLKPGDSVQIRFWIKGPENTTQIKMQIRRDVAPWTSFFKASIPLDNQWQEHVFNVTLPDNLTEGKTSLMFNLTQEIPIWIDDVSVVKLESKEAGDVLPGNQLLNASFEVGTDKWYATFRESAGYASTPEATENNIKADIHAIEQDDVPQGNRCLQFEIFPQCRIQLTSAFFNLKYGHDTKISFWVKNNGIQHKKIKVALVGGEFPNVIEQGETFVTKGEKWVKHTFYITPKPSVGGRYILDIKVADVGSYMIDDIQVMQDTSPDSDMLTRPNVGWTCVDPQVRSNIYALGSKPEFNILVQGLPCTKNMLLVGRLIDVSGRELEPLSMDIALDFQGMGQSKIFLPANQYGAFKAELYLAGHLESDIPAVEIIYTVPMELPDPKTINAKSSFFGGHVNFTPYNLYLAKMAGFRWLRCHPPLDTKWQVVEPEKGEFKFSTHGVKRASDMGFAVMGSFDSVPDFYSDKPEGAFHTWYRCYPPKGEAGWKAWETYVAKTEKAFGPYIDTWEICNEPDGGFMQIPTGMVREEIYLDYVTRTQAALNNRKDVTLIAGVITGADRPFMQRILDMDVSKHVDGISFHEYRRNIKESLPKRQEQIRHWQTYSNRNGQPLSVWHSEGFVLQHTPTWLKTTQHTNAFNSALSPGLGAAKTIQSIVSFKAMGARSHFLYAAYAAPSGAAISRTDYALITDINGMASPGLPAHAAAVYFLDGAAPNELTNHVTQNGDGYTIASFTKNGHAIWVAWADKLVDVSQITSLKSLGQVRMHDMMGNELPEMNKETLTAMPVYFVQQ